MNGTFYTWLSGQRLRRDVVGLIANLVQHDKWFPRQADSLHQLMKYYDEAHGDHLHGKLFLTSAHRNLIKKAHKQWRNSQKPLQVIVDDPLAPLKVSGDTRGGTVCPWSTASSKECPTLGPMGICYCTAKKVRS